MVHTWGEFQGKRTHGCCRSDRSSSVVGLQDRDSCCLGSIGLALDAGGQHMHVPGLMERVHLGGLDEVYLVTRVDDAGQVADLLPLIYGSQPLLSVPFLVVESIPGCGPPPFEARLLGEPLTGETPTLA